MTPFIIALFASVTVAMVTYQVLPTPRADVVRRLDAREGGALATEGSLQALSALAGHALGRLAPTTWLVDARRDLYWAQLAGKWQGWTPVSFWGLRLIGAIAGVILATLLPSMPIWSRFAFIGAGVLLPSRRLNGDAEEVKKLISRELPIAARAMALLVDTGLPVSEALEEVASGEGMLARWLRRHVMGDSGRLFSRYAADGRLLPGRLRREAEKAGHPALRAFAVQLDLVAQRGTGIREAMHALAEATANAYFAQMDREAEGLDSRMTVPVFIFFMLPYLVIAVLPALIGAAQLLMFR